MQINTLTDLIVLLIDMYLEVGNGKCPISVNETIHAKRVPHILPKRMTFENLTQWEYLMPPTSVHHHPNIIDNKIQSIW